MTRSQAKAKWTQLGVTWRPSYIPEFAAPLPLEVYQPMIRSLMRTFDFKAVKVVMDFKQWGWAGCRGVPTLRQIRAHAEKLLLGVATDKWSYGECGGFTARRTLGETDCPCLELEFSLKGDTEFENGKAW